MDVTVKFRQLFDFSKLPILIVAAVLALLTIAIVVMYVKSWWVRKKKVEKPVEVEEEFVAPDLGKLKGTYLAKLDEIEAKFNQDPTQIRPAYEGMSRVVREFVYKATGTEVDKFTLHEISQTKFQGLAQLVGEYYQPEFDQISEGDVRDSLMKSRRLMSEWN
jgi:Na+-transporting methylmalonyl-CoA/oxaloacetate decarboxylase gamma subunit